MSKVTKNLTLKLLLFWDLHQKLEKNNLSKFMFTFTQILKA